ncbi:MAG: glycoside hydrolase family 3 C-terminal domain-containing protein [Alistipes sp.]|nr:glycoside hydrolase family 3 C-terminal domain-containing protein [Alistipes sp.]
MKRLVILCAAIATAMSATAAEPLKLNKDNIDEIIKELTLKEKAHLVVGTRLRDNKSAAGEVGYTRKIIPGAAGTTYPIERLGIPSIVLADGPAGLRISPTREGSDQTFYCTGFPVGTHLAATWNADIINKVGQAMGNEVLEYGVDVLLAPGINMMRNPLCGRNFEYYSEDPLLAGKTAAAMINGIESNGVGTSLKHFAGNSQEINRLANDARISLRALREIYLKNFEIAVREAQPWTIMTSYNYINGRYTSEDRGLLEDILRGEWGFEGAVMTDWGGGVDAVKQMWAGNDMLQPGRYEDVMAIVEGVQSGKLSQADLDRNVRRVLELIVRSPRFAGYQYSNKPDLKAHAALTREVASEGFVLLKNDGDVMPLAKGEKVALFGSASYDFIAGGRGSGDVNKAYVVDLRDGLIGNEFVLNESLDKLYKKHMEREEKRLAPIVALRQWYVYNIRPNEMKDPYAFVRGTANDSNVAIITISRNSAEAFDRHVVRDFQLSINETALLNSVSREFHAQGKKVIVVLNVCGPVEVASWRDKVDGILVCWMPGQEGGNSVADVLLGRVSPSGHLPMTFPMSYADVPSQNFPINVPETGLNQSFENQSKVCQPYDIPNVDYTNYEEDIYIGYRHFATRNVPVAYPFGYGLTYSKFEASAMQTIKTKSGFEVTCKVSNVGKFPAKQVVQLYSTELAPETDRPAIELRGYKKTPLLQPGESCEVTIAISNDDLATYSEKESAWKVRKGDYRLSLGFDSATLPLSKVVTIKKEKVTPVTDVMKPEKGEIFIK